MLTLTFGRGPRPPDVMRDHVGDWRDTDGSLIASALARGACRWIEWPGLGTFAFSLGATTVQAWPASGVRRTFVVDVFARVVQPVILQALGRQTLHASAVLGRSGVLAFCGVGRSGKSTLAYALARAGLRQIADDALVIETRGTEVVAQPLPFRSQLRDDSRRHFGERPDRSSATEEGSRLPRGEPAKAPLRGVFLLRQDTTITDLATTRRLAPVQAFSGLLAHAHCFDQRDPDFSRRLVEDYLAFAERVPVIVLTYKAEFAQLPELVDYVLATATDQGLSVHPIGEPAPRA